MDTVMDKSEAFLRLPDVMARTGLSKTEIYRRIGAGLFPAQTRLSYKLSVWRESEIVAWLRARVSAPFNPDGYVPAMRRASPTMTFEDLLA